MSRVDRSTPWEIKEEAGAAIVTRLDATGRRLKVYDNWAMLTKAQAQAICYALNVLEHEEAEPELLPDTEVAQRVFQPDQ